MIPNTIKDDLERIIKQAGKVLLSFWGKKLHRQQKLDGFVTEADLASEKYLIENLTQLFPEADFWAEESGQAGTNNNGYRWVIDPLDGTTNFAHHIPYFCISVALTHYDKPICSAIYNPLQDEFFYAQEGQGAWLNGQKIAVSSVSSISQAFIAFGTPYSQDKRLSVVIPAQKLAKTARAVRYMGAIALDLAFVAAGRFDGVFFVHLAWWDVAAGMLLVEQAGGKITDFEGNAISPSYQTCVAGGELVYDNLYKLLAFRDEI